ncbi:MAG: pantoate--beta-alanine ligase, partial [Nitrospirales bacterium]
PAEDLDQYPRSFNTDRRLCREAGVDLLFAPSREEFYPSDFQTTVNVNRLTKRWEGEARSTHFQGVTTVVTKLFCLIRPHLAYFGQKDYQQSLVVNQLIRDLNWDMRMIRCPTIRESDGLAVSSRNRYLPANRRMQAGLLSKALAQGVDSIRNGERKVQTIQARMQPARPLSQKISLIRHAQQHLSAFSQWWFLLIRDHARRLEFLIPRHRKNRRVRCLKNFPKMPLMKMFRGEAHASLLVRGVSAVERLSPFLLERCWACMMASRDAGE